MWFLHDGAVWLCCLENWLGSSTNHMQGWMTVWECCRYALERGCLFVTVLKWKGLRVEWIPWSLQGGHCRCRHVTMMECVSGRLIRHPSVAAALANVFAASGSDYKEEELSFIFSILNLLFFRHPHQIHTWTYCIFLCSTETDGLFGRKRVFLPKKSLPKPGANSIG